MSDVVMDESMMDGDAGKTDQSNRMPTSAGQRLSARREALGWTIEQVSSQLNLAPRQIHALETDNFAALPGMAISRGFIRAYAKLLKIDPAPLLALVSTDASPAGEPLPMRHALSASFSESRLPSMGADGSSNKRAMIGLLAAVLIGGSVAALQMGAFPNVSDALSAKMKALSTRDSSQPGTNAEKSMAEESSKTMEVAGSSDSAPGPASSPVAAPDKASDPANAAAPNQVAVAPPEPAPNGSTTVTLPVPAAVASAVSSTEIPPVTPVASLAASAVAKPPTAATPAAPIAASTVATASTDATVPAKDALVLKLREDSWVEIKGKNKVLISRVVKAGSTETFDIAEPVSLTIGNASGVDGLFRGAAIDFKSATKTNVVKMNLK